MNRERDERLYPEIPSFDALVALTDPIVQFAEVLGVLGRHAAAMDQADETRHDACTYCETMKLLSRVAAFGIQLRQAERS